MAAIELDHVTKAFAGGVVAADDVTLTVADGEFMVLVGPSGCGKSTLWRMIAGLEEITEGTISIGDVDVTDFEPPDRDIAMVFQNYALYPHMSVRENLGFGLSVRRTPKREIVRRVQEVATLLGLQDLLERKPAYLSDGQRQRGDGPGDHPRAEGLPDGRAPFEPRREAPRWYARVARAAACAARRDEHLRDARSDRGDDAWSPGRGDAGRPDRPGRRAATALPGPKDLFVGAFIGSPSMNLVEATLDADQIAFGQFRVPLDPGRRPARDIDRVILGVRPEAFNDASHAGSHLPRIDVTVDVLEELGSDTFVSFHVVAPRVTIESRVADEDEASLLVEEDSFFTARVEATTSARVGAPLQLAVDPSKFHFFDLRSSESLLRIGPSQPVP